MQASAVCLKLCALKCLQVYFHIYNEANRKVSDCVCVFFFFVFVMNACLPAAQADTTATEILNPDSGLFNYSYCYCGAQAERAKEREMEEESGSKRRGGGVLSEEEGCVVFPKKGSLRDGICM